MQLQEDRTTISGAAAELHWGTAPAATLGAWSVTGKPGEWTFTAEILKVVSSFRISQQPLFVVTPSRWRWRVNEITFNADKTALTASISPLEK